MLVSIVAAGIALYGAINSARALRWQRHRDDERRRVRAQLIVTPWIRTVFGDSIPPERRAPGRVERSAGLRLVVVNKSEERAILLRELAVFKRAGGSIGNLVLHDADVRLQPHERHVAELDLTNERGSHTFHSGFVATARLASGEFLEEHGVFSEEALNVIYEGRPDENEGPP
jgi:hypothetical protein